MPTLSIDDFMASRTAQAAPVAATPTGKRTIAISPDGTAMSDTRETKAAPMGIDDFMSQRKASGHAPDWTDDVKASAKFLGNEIVGVGQAVNPYNIAKGAVNMIAHPIDTVKGMIDTPGRIYEQYQSGDMDGLAQSLGNVAGTIIAGKAAPEVPGVARTGAQALGNGIDGAVAGVKAAASNGTVQAVAPVIAKMAAKTLVKGALGAKAGPLGVIAYDLLEDAVKSRLEAAKPKPVTTSSSIPTKVTPTSSTNVVNVAQSAGKGARTMDTMKLDPETTQALVDATKAGDIAKLPAPVKTELTQAVKAGDSAKVNEIVEEHSGDVRKREAGKAKTDVIVRYIQDHNIDLNDYKTAADRQTLADAAYGHGVKHGMNVPVKTGKYRGISDETWGHIQRRIGGN